MDDDGNRRRLELQAVELQAVELQAVELQAVGVQAVGVLEAAGLGGFPTRSLGGEDVATRV